MPIIIPTPAFLSPLDLAAINMSDDDIEPLTPNTILSAQEIDEMVSQFRLFTRRLSQQSVFPPSPPVLHSRRLGR